MMRDSIGSVVRGFAGFVLIAALGGCQKAGMEFRGVNMDRAELRPQALEVDFALKFRINNPLSVDLVILPHQVSFTLFSRDPAVPNLSATLTPELPPDNRVPHNGAADLTYKGALVLPVATPQQRNAFSGDDIPYELLATIDFNPTPWGPQTLPLRYRNEIRIPRFPEVALRNGPDAANRFGLEDISPTRQTQIITPLRFVDQAVPAAVTTMLVAADVVLDDSQMITANCVFGRMPANNSDRDKCISATTINGVVIRAPISIKNPNAFSIAMPSMSVALRSGSSEFYNVHTTGSGSLQPGQTRPAELVTTLTFPSELNTPGLESTLQLDLGFGLWKFPLKFP